MGQLILDQDTRLVAPRDFDYTGHGTYLLPNGSRLEGQFEDGLLQGQGRRETSLGVYQGHFVAGQRSGQGRQTDQSGAIYDGAWQANQRHGMGAQVYADGSGYEGEWVRDKHEGFGAWRSKTGARYEGKWSQGVRRGYGVSNDADGVIYEGMWLDDEKSGYGQEKRPDGFVYDGQWDAGRKQGQGEARLTNGAWHTGTWEAGHILGIGSRVTREGIILSGLWTRNLFSNGMVVLPDGHEFAGPVFTKRGQKTSVPFTAWLSRKASSGSAYAQYLLAATLMDLPLQSDEAQPVVPLLKASIAKANISDAHYRLAGLLLENDSRAALGHLKAAAKQGHGPANARLGEYYHSGRHLQKDLQAAAHHYEVAARQGHAAAKNNLAWLLATQPGELSNPQHAVDLIQPLVLYTGNWQYLDTLAAAHAALARFRLATLIQKQAIRAYRQARDLDAADVGNLEELAHRLRLYETQTAYRE